MATPDVTQKSRIYHTLSELNTAFAAIVGHCNTLQQTGLFKSKAANVLPSFVAGAASRNATRNFLKTLSRSSLTTGTDTVRSAQKWEKYLGDPDDVFIHAEERRKELAKQRKKKKGQ